MSLILYETPLDSLTNLAPLDRLRAQCDIIVGAASLRDRVERLQGRRATILTQPRAGIATLDGAAVPAKAAGLYLPANTLWNMAIPIEGPEEYGVCSDSTGTERIAYMRLGADRAARFDLAAPERSAADLPKRPCSCIFLDRPWDIIRHLPVVLAEDCRGFASTQAASARIASSAVLDESEGAIIIGEDAVIEPLAYIAGPTLIGRRAVVKAHAAIRCSALGEETRVGGEVTCSQIFPFSNKQHDGFLGHCVVASWVNIGAGTTGSNLKNTYGEIRIDGEGTGLNYLGQIIGDHTKIGIQGTMNTGSIYGIFCNLVAGSLTTHGEPFPKRVSDFIFNGERGDLESLLKTARLAMARRNQELSPYAEALVRALYVQGRRS